MQLSPARIASNALFDSRDVLLRQVPELRTQSFVSLLHATDKGSCFDRQTRQFLAYNLRVILNCDFRPARRSVATSQFAQAILDATFQMIIIPLLILKGRFFTAQRINHRCKTGLLIFGNLPPEHPEHTDVSQTTVLFGFFLLRLLRRANYSILQHNHSIFKSTTY